MNDIKDLLAAALKEEPNPMNTELVTPTVDPAGDLARGKVRLRRRRVAILTGAAAAVLLAGAVGAITLNGDVESPAPSAQRAVVVLSSGPSVAVQQPIVLVAYTGHQPQGYKVSWVPDGWVIQGADATSLTIAPKDAADKDPSSFLNKLTVLSASSDQPVESMTKGTPVKVGKQDGYLATPPGDGTQILSYQDVSGRWVQVQVPPLLHWNADQIAKFAAGVTVLKGAADTHG